MYHCYLRGKQNELLAIRESMFKIVSANMTVIVEPVRTNFKPLLECVKYVEKNDANFVLIINPCVSNGELTGNQAAMNNLMQELLEIQADITLGLIIDQTSTIDLLKDSFSTYPNNPFVLIHFGESSLVQHALRNLPTEQITKNIFISGQVSSNYINQFGSTPKVLLTDCFKKQSKNANYKHNKNEVFFDLSVTDQWCKQNNFSGFGDFSIIGNHYSDSGSTPRTVAIHLTYDKNNNDNTVIYIYHFLSNERNDKEELQTLIEEAFNNIAAFSQKKPEIKIWSTACQDILKKIENNDKTNLGYLKKISIKHHFDLMHYLKINNIY